MTEELKAQIVHQLSQYIDAHKGEGMSQNKVAAKCGVSPATLSYLLQNRWNDVPSQGGAKKTAIGDQIFLKIQKALGLTVEVFETENYMAIFSACLEAKVHLQCRIIDGATGLGKSFALEQFARLNPKETFLVRCKNTMNAKEFMQAVARTIGACEVGTRYKICTAIAEKLQTMTNPLLLIDESEALFKRTSEGGFGAIKDIYDEVRGRAGIVLVGANEFAEQLRLRAADLRSCFPQLHSRFKANAVELVQMTRDDVASIAPQFGVTDRKEINTLFDTSVNYRDLFDTLRAMQAEQQLMEVA